MQNYKKSTNLFGNVQNVLFLLRLTDDLFYSNIGCSKSKVIFKWRKHNNNKQKQKKSLQGANVRTSCISYSLSQNSHRTRQTNAGDKGCAEACAERFSALKDQHWRHVVSSLSRSHFRNVFVKFSEIHGFDLLSFYKGLRRIVFTQISLRMVLFSLVKVKRQKNICQFFGSFNL